MKIIKFFFVFSLFVASAAAQSKGVVECLDRSSIPAWESPGSIAVTKQLSCGQEVLIAGIEKGFIKIRINEKYFAFVEAKYIRSIEKSETDQRISELEKQIAELKQQAPSNLTQSISSRENESGSKYTKPEIDHNQKSPRNSEEAYNFPKFEITSGYSFVALGRGIGNIDGWTTSVAGNFNKTIGIKAELSGLYGKNTVVDDVRYSAHSFMAGPQISAREKSSWSGELHILLGGTHITGSAPFLGYRINESTNVFSMALGAGINWHRNKDIGWRIVQGDYVPFYSNGVVTHNFRFSTGIIFRLAR
jgi:hypothetical protein